AIEDGLRGLGAGVEHVGQSRAPVAKLKLSGVGSGLHGLKRRFCGGQSLLLGKRLVEGASNAEGHVLVGLNKVCTGSELFGGSGVDLSPALTEVEDQLLERYLGD